jgi:hypothetical protein
VTLLPVARSRDSVPSGRLGDVKLLLPCYPAPVPLNMVLGIQGCSAARLPRRVLPRQRAGLASPVCPRQTATLARRAVTPRFRAREGVKFTARQRRDDRRRLGGCLQSAIVNHKQLYFGPKRGRVRARSSPPGVSNPASLSSRWECVRRHKTGAYVFFGFFTNRNRGLSDPRPRHGGKMRSRVLFLALVAGAALVSPEESGASCARSRDDSTS